MCFGERHCGCTKRRGSSKQQDEEGDEKIAELVDKLKAKKFKAMYAELDSHVRESYEACDKLKHGKQAAKAKVVNQYLEKEGSRWITHPERPIFKEYIQQINAKFNKQQAVGV